MAAPLGWVGEQFRVYFDNAPMSREYRTQLRGSKAPWFLVVYLCLMMFIAMIVYWGIQFAGSKSVSEMQSGLTGLFYAVIGMLDGLVALIAPVVAASSIIGEYERKSIELVFTSPMSAKYFLVGKMVASYRYVAMLIVMALPFAALSVVLGGATWQDVVSAFILVSIHGLIYMAVSLPIAVMSSKSVPAVVLSYLANFLLINVLAAYVGPGMLMGQNAEWPAGFVPYFTGTACRSSVDILGWPVPAWLPCLLVTLLFLKLMVVGAGSALTQGGSKDTVGVRIHGWVYTAVVGWLVGSAIGASGGIAGTSLAGPFYAMTWPLFVCVPYFSSFIFGGNAKVRSNGMFNVRQVLRGTPASGLPYLLSILLVGALALCVSASVASGSVGPIAVSLAGLLGVFVVWVFLWSLGWLSSSFFATQTPDAPRRLHILFMFVALLVSWIGLWIVQSSYNAATKNWSGDSIVKLYPFSLPFDDDFMCLAKTAVLAVAALAIGGWAELRRRKGVAELVSVYDRA